MRLQRIASTLLSGVVVYALVAACSAAGSSLDPLADDAGGAPVPSVSPVPNAMADEWHTPGSRLKLRYYAFADGAKQFAGWYDAELQAPCSLLPHHDGETRCVPSGASVDAYFGDDACTQRLALIKAGTVTPKFVQEFDNASKSYRAYFLGAGHSGSVYSGVPGACAETGGLGGFVFFKLGPQLPGTSMVAAELTTAP